MNNTASNIISWYIQINRARRWLADPPVQSSLDNIFYHSATNIKRYEIKYECDLYQQIHMLKYLGPWFVDYPTRIINSLYYDTNELLLFHHNEDGIVPRIKLRKRWYGENYCPNSISMFEIKGTFDNCRKKTLFNPSEYYKIINKLNYDKINFSSLIPISVVKYNRKYYKNSKNIRLTVDQPIYYSKFQNGSSSLSWVKDTSYVFEFKTDSKALSEMIKQNIPYQNTKFSKYARSVELLGFL